MSTHSAAPAARRAAPSLTGFFIAAAFVSALGFLPMVWASHRGAAAVPAAVKPLQLIMLFGPALLAITWAAREGGRAGVRALLAGVLRWRMHPAWYAAALLGPAAVYLAALLLARLTGAPDTPIPVAGRALAALGPTFVGYLLLNTEELAWRGYAWPRMRDRLGALRGSVLLGLLWGTLHAPLFLMKGGHPGGWPPALFLGLTVAFGVLFSLAYEGSGGSVLLVHLLHQSLNAWGDVLPVYPRVTGSLVPAVLMVVLGTLLAVVGAARAGWRWAPARARRIATA